MNNIDNLSCCKNSPQKRCHLTYLHLSYREWQYAALFLVGCRIQRLMAVMLHDRLKQNPTNKKIGELNLKLNYIFGI